MCVDRQAVVHLHGRAVVRQVQRDDVLRFGDPIGIIEAVGEVGDHGRVGSE